MVKSRKGHAMLTPPNPISPGGTYVIQDQIIEMLPDNEEEALWALASVVEAVTSAIGESHEDFFNRVKAYKDRRGWQRSTAMPPIVTTAAPEA